MGKSSRKIKLSLCTIIIAVFVVISIVITATDYFGKTNIWNFIYTSVGLGKDAYKNDTRIIFADVGQGDCMIIMSESETAVIDSGPYSASDELIRYLLTLGIKEIDYLVATHPHEDHMGSFADIIDKIGAKRIIMQEANPSGDADASAYERLKAAVSENGVAKAEPYINMKIDVGETNITVIGPVGEYVGNENNLSLILKVETKALSFLITGDAEEDAEQDLINVYGNSLKADVLKAGHHGSKTSTTDKFLTAVSPEYVVFCAGKGNTFGHPTDEVLSRVNSFGSRILRTDYNGNITFIIDDIYYDLKTDN